MFIVDDEFPIADGLHTQVQGMDLPVCAVAQASIHRQMIGLTDVRLRSDMDGVDATLAIHCILEAKIGFITGSSDPATMARIQLDHPLAVLR